MRHLIGIATIVFVLPLQAADFDDARLAKIPVRMKQFVDEQQLAGAVVVVGSSRGIALIDAVGQLDIKKKTPMKKDSLFRIASMTKPITALAVVKLAEEGKLKLDDPVEKHLPEFRGQMLVVKRDQEGELLRKPARPIALRDLLTHTSGLPNFPAGIADIYMKRDRTLAEATLIMSQRPLEFAPGSKWAYCNSGIDVLGRVVEVVTGMSFEDYLARRVFQPLGMKETTFYPAPEQHPRIAGLYDVKDGKLIESPPVVIGSPKNAKHPIPAGGLYSTGEDIAKLYQAMLLKGKLGETRILGEEGIAEMTKVQTGDLKCGFTEGIGFGLGWQVVRKPEGVTSMLSAGTYGHGGAFGTQGWIDPHKDVFVILLIQRVGLAGGDASEPRKELQRLAFEAIEK